MNKFFASQIGVAETVESLANALDTTRGGTFAVLHEYDNEGNSKLAPEGKSEIATYGLQFGIGYENIKNRSVALLIALLEYAKGNGPFPEGIETSAPNTIEFSYMTFIDPEGNEHSRNKKDSGRIRKKVKVVLTDNPAIVSSDDADEDSVLITYGWNEPKVIEALEKASQIQDRPAEHLEKEGKSFYGHVENGTLYLRDCLVINKNTVQKGDWKESNTSFAPALKSALTNLTPVGHYRMFKINTGSFKALSVGGRSYVTNEGGEVFQTLPEYAKAFIEQDQVPA